MLGQFGLDVVTVREDLTQYSPEGWTSELESDVDGRNSGPLSADPENLRFGWAVTNGRIPALDGIGEMVREVPGIAVEAGLGSERQPLPGWWAVTLCRERASL